MIYRKSQRQPVKVCCEKDPAIDPDRSDFFSYRQDPENAEKYLAFKPGGVPTWFELRALDSIEYEEDALAPTRAHANSDTVIRSRFLNRKMLELSLVAVHNWEREGDRVDGKSFKGWREIPPDFLQWMGDVVSEMTSGQVSDSDGAAFRRMIKIAASRSAALEQFLSVLDAQLESHGELKRAIEANGEIKTALEVARGVLDLGPHERYDQSEAAQDPKKS